jgi:glutamine synthetase
LDEAVSELEEDTVILEALGAHVYERFISAKRLEWEDYRIEVTPWELEKYLSIY